MPYYQGDYYAGDYAGDPFFGSLLAKIGRGIVGIGRRAAPKLLPGPAAGMAQSGARAAIMRVGARVGGAVMKHPVLSAAGAAGTIGVLGGAVAQRVMEPGVPMRGFHVSARTGKLVKNRRMHVTNPKALRRAIRRAAGFARLARKVMHFTSPRPPRGRAYFRPRTKKSRKIC